jgi:predicted ATPase
MEVLGLINRIFVNNFKTLVNFDINFNETTLLIGANGSGKTSVFEVIKRLRDFITEAKRPDVDELFPTTDFTCWHKRNSQEFELEVSTTCGIYVYKLVVELFNTKTRIREESLSLNKQNLYQGKMKNESNRAVFKGILYTDSGKSVEVGFDWSYSGVSMIQERADNTFITEFKRALSNVVVVRPIPQLITIESEHEDSKLSFQSENFAAWYRYLTQEDMGAVVDLMSELKSVLPGFRALNSVEAGERRLLKAQFAGNGPANQYNFASLSDGQKLLIVLYAVMIGYRKKNACLFIDEPDNFLSIEEIQPWLRLFIDDCGKD